MKEWYGCKCGAESPEDHIAKVAAGYPGHVYKGPVGFLLDQETGP